MAPRAAVIAAVVLVVVAGQLLCVVDGGVVPAGSCVDGGAALGQCAAEEELVRQPSVKHISYAALIGGDHIPCGRRGQSYYTNCPAMKEANPYTRGCSAITRCARDMS